MLLGEWEARGEGVVLAGRGISLLSPRNLSPKEGFGDSGYEKFNKHLENDKEDG
jgi:hypothetical protein